MASLLFAAPLAAQTGLGVVRGTVQDASKAIIPNVKVTLTNADTGVVHETQTNTSGIYYFGAVEIGKYSLVAEAQGFKKWEGTFTVEAGQTLVIDPGMEVGSLQSAVEVTSAAPIIATEGGQVSDVKDALAIHDLPLNQRQISQLFSLTPGVVGDSSGNGSPRTNGMKAGSTEMNLDGISYVDRFGGGISRVQPGLDTVQEFRIETAGSGAQYSRPATIELVTRSGTNEIHGAGFEVFRNNADGLRARAIQDGNTAAKLIRNEYGGWMGGPVLIPKLYNGKNKTFWFFDWEGLKQRQQNFAQTAVPTAAMWNGDLSNITDSSSDKYTIYDPNSTSGPNGTRVPFANNIIPSSRLTPYAKIFQSVTPTPNIAGNLNPWIDQNFRTNYPLVTNQHTMTIKIDHNFSEKDNISGRFTDSPYFNALYGGLYGFPPPGCTNCGGTSETDVTVYSTYARWNHVFKPTLLNELQLSGHRSPTHYGTLGDSTNWANKLGLPNPFGVNGWPTVYTDAYNMLYGGGWDGDNNHRQNLTAYEIDDNVTWIKGKHTIKAGFKGRQEYNNVEELQQAEGSHGFYANWTALYDPSAQAAAPFTGSGFGELLMGLPTALRNQYNRGFFYFQQKETDAYVNDTWKVSPRLTVDVGLRWDHWTPYHEKQNRLVNLDPTSYSGFTVISPYNVSINSLPGVPSGVLASYQARGLSWVTADSVSGFPKALVPNVYGDFAPRLAAAYRVSDKWVVRAGYGMYYWPMPLSQILQASRTNPPLNLDFVQHFDNKNVGNTTIFNYGLLNVPSSGDYLPNATVNVNGVQGIGSQSLSMFIFDPHHWSDDRMQQWTFTIERELMKNTSLRFSYIGNHGSNLEQRLAWNSAEAQWNYQTQTGLAAPVNKDLLRPNANWNGTVESHVGYSNANSFQLELQRRFSSGLSFQWFYVYDHVLTTSDESGYGDGGGGALVPENSTILGAPNLTLSQRLKLVYANSALVPPQQIKWNGIYELPFGNGKHFGSHVSHGLNQIAGGWQLAFIGNWQGGSWIGANSNNGNGLLSNSEYLFGNPSLGSGKRLDLTIFGKNQQLWFAGDFDPTQASNVNLSALEALIPADRAQRILRPLGPAFDNKLLFLLANGNIRPTTITDLFSWNPRTFMLSPGMWDQDISVFKYFDIIERVKLRFTADFFNAFNHPLSYIPGDPNHTLNTNTGLLDLSKQENDGTNASGGPRTIQLSLRLEF
ncbi:MAG TPA: TonB-dependent receptor [Bryobacteraceae bacterium]|nr:TonB-dependent receptor [Bryobacteraceae bacterium]